MTAGESATPVPQPAPVVRRPIPRRRKIVFISIIFVFIFVVQELFCRWLFPVPEVRGFNRITYTQLHLFSPELATVRQRGLSNVKFRWECEPDGFAFEHTLNLYGFRGPDFRIARDPGRKRIVFVGDSFTEGCGASDRDTIAEQFVRTLEAPSSVEAINLGVSAAAFTEYTLMTRDAVDLLQPDAVFVVVCHNDLPAPPQPQSTLDPPPEFPRSDVAMPRAVEALSRYLSGLSVPRRFPGGPFPFFDPVPSDTNPMTFQKPAANIDDGVLNAMQQGKANPWNAGTCAIFESALRNNFTIGGSAKGYLTRMRALCTERGAKLIIVYIPYLVTANHDYLAAQQKLGGPIVDARVNMQEPKYRSQQDHLRSVCADLGVPFLDTTERFIEAEKQSRMFWPIDGHCNADGYRLIAQVCARFWTTGDVPK